MRGNWPVLATSVLVLALGPSPGCFRQVQEQVTTDSVSFIVVEGAGDPVRIVIDGVTVAEEADLYPSEGVRYKVARGAHDVTISRGGEILAERRIYVGDGETRILKVPGG